MKWNMGFYGKLQVPDMRLALSGYNLYVCCTDFVDLPELIKVLNLPDTFNSWFLLLQLHLWMVNVKVSQMGKEGVLLKKHIYKAMWNNVEKRLKTFKDLQSKDRSIALSNYHSTMIMSIMYYDEGLIGSDKLLANALWVQLFSMDPAVDADKLELMVKYVRKQVHHHDQLEHSAILKPGFISFLPLLDDKLDQKRALQQLDSLHLN
jgi:cytochrome b pre-mRNA-processing protein 3